MREKDQILDDFLKRDPELAQAAAAKHLENQMQLLKIALELEDEEEGERLLKASEKKLHQVDSESSSLGGAGNLLPTILHQTLGHFFLSPLDLKQNLLGHL